MYITHNKTRIYIHTHIYIYIYIYTYVYIHMYIICTSYTTCATPLLHSTVFRNPNFEAVRIQLVCNGFSCFLVFLLNGCPMPNLTISPREVATEKRNLDPLAGRLVVFLNCMTSPSFLIGGELLPSRGKGLINTNLALISVSIYGPVFGGPPSPDHYMYNVGKT